MDNPAVRAEPRRAAREDGDAPEMGEPVFAEFPSFPAFFSVFNAAALAMATTSTSSSDEVSSICKSGYISPGSLWPLTSCRGEERVIDDEAEEEAMVAEVVETDRSTLSALETLIGLKIQAEADVSPIDSRAEEAPSFLFLSFLLDLSVST